MKRVIIVGAGPGGIAAANRLQTRAATQIEIILVERGGVAEFLPGTLSTALGQQPLHHWQQPLVKPGIQVQAGEAHSVSGMGVVVEGVSIAADAVIAAPGLTLDAIPTAANRFAFWSPTTAAAAMPAITSLTQGTVVVAISGLPYRCPPAPFSLAMQLADYYRNHSRPVQVILTTPEEKPLAVIGQGVPEFLLTASAAAGVTVHTSFVPQWSEADATQWVAQDGKRVAHDLALIVPPHIRSPLLRHLPGEGVFVPVGAGYETDEPGLFVVGDAAKTPYPRAAGAAAAQGQTAADAILVRLGLADSFTVHLPAPECYIGHGAGVFSRITMRYPHGLPPAGKPEVILDAPTPDLATSFAQAFATWQELRR